MKKKNFYCIEYSLSNSNKMFHCVTFYNMFDLIKWIIFIFPRHNVLYKVTLTKHVYP